MSESSEAASAATGTTTETTALTPPADGQQASTLLGGEDAGDDAAVEGSDSAVDGGDGEGQPTVPDAYEFKVPEGIEGVEIDQGLADQFTPVFKELGLTQEKADKLVKVYAERVAADNKAQHDALVEGWQTKVKGWEETARKDTEYGGEHFDANLKIAQHALGKYSSPELNKLLVETGLGSHPDLIRAFVRIGKATAEDQPGQTTAEGSPEAKDLKAVLYPNG